MLDLIKELLMKHDCQILTDDGQYFVYQYDAEGGKNPLSHSESLETAVNDAFLEINAS